MRFHYFIRRCVGRGISLKCVFSYFDTATVDTVNMEKETDEKISWMDYYLKVTCIFQQFNPFISNVFP